MSGLIYLILICFINGSYGYTSPSVNLTSCMYNTASVKISNAPVGGIVYFRTDTAYNLVQTTGGTMVHECTFEHCNINWDERFYVVVQRNVYIQTKDDVIIWFICNTDFSAIRPVDIDFLGNEDSNLTVTMYKPEVSMMIYKGGNRLTSGSDVKLGDEITMIMNVTNNANDYFDISAKACYASGITLLDESCPVDVNLFGLFNSTRHGYLEVTFDMFRPTNIAGGPTEVVFTCILEVCLWKCPETDCSSRTNNTKRRRKRDDDEELIDDEDDIPNIVRGYRLLALAEGEELTVDDEEEVKIELCVPLYIIITIAGISTLIIGGGVTLFTSSFKNVINHKKTVAQLKKSNDIKACNALSENKVSGVPAVNKGNLHLTAASSPYRRKSLTNVG